MCGKQNNEKKQYRWIYAKYSRFKSKKRSPSLFIRQSKEFTAKNRFHNHIFLSFTTTDNNDE